MLCREVVLAHLSKEIEILMNNIYLFRTKSAFTLWIGPFVLLGTMFVATQAKVHLEFSGLVVSALVLLVIAYLALGIAASQIEKINWERCDQLRALFANAAQNESYKIELDKFLDPSRAQNIRKYYAGIFLIVAISIGCVAVIAFSLRPLPQ